MTLTSSCLLESDNDSMIYAGHINVGGVLVGTIMKVSLIGELQWSQQSSDTTANTLALIVACSNSYAYLAGDSSSALLTSPPNNVVYVIKHAATESQSGLILWTKALQQTSYLPSNDQLLSFDVSPDGYFIYVVFQSIWNLDSSTNLRFLQLQASDGSVSLAKGIQSIGSYAGRTISNLDYQFSSRRVRVTPDSNYIFIAHKIKANAYGLTGLATQDSAAIVKLNCQNLDIEWYMHTSGADRNDQMDTLSVPLFDNSIIAGGCFRSSSISNSPSATTICDMTFMRISSDGSLKWAVSGGGPLDERVFELSVLPISQEIFYASGAVQSPAYTSVGSVGAYQFFVSKHVSATGSLLDYKVFTSTSVKASLLTTSMVIRSTKGVFLFIGGHSEDPSISFRSTQFSWFFMKSDLTLEDSNCFTPLAVQPTFITVTAALAARWTTINGLSTLPHTEISMMDMTNVYVPQARVRNVDFLLLPTTTCIQPMQTPLIPDKQIQIGNFLSADQFNSYFFEGLCYQQQPLTWDYIQLVQTNTGIASLPLNIIFYPANQSIDGSFKLAGIYTFDLRRQASYIQPQRTATVFTVFATNNAPQTIGQQSNVYLPSGEFFLFTIKVVAVFIELDHEAMTFAALNANGEPIPEWIRFYQANQTFIGTAPYVSQSISFIVNLTAYDPQFSNASTSFTIYVVNQNPTIVMEQESQTICLYADSLNIASDLRTEVEQMFQDRETQALSYQLVGDYPSFINFDPLGMVITQTPTQSIVSGHWSFVLQATDSEDVSIQSQLQLDIWPVTPSISFNISCIDWRTFQYLDNEGEGIYYMSFQPCFVIPSGMQVWYEGTYSDGTSLPSQFIQTNVSTGELQINATEDAYGKYLIMITATPSSGGCLTTKTSMYLNLIINKPPILNTTQTQHLSAYTWETFIFTLPWFWFIDPESQQLKITLTTSNSDQMDYSWVKYYDGQVKAISGSPTIVGLYMLYITASDPYGLSVTKTLLINAAHNTPPKSNTSSLLQYQVPAGLPFNIILPTSLFYDADGDRLSITIDNQNQSWINLNPLSMTITGLAPIQNSTYPFQIYAQDHVGWTSFSTIQGSINVYQNSSAPCLLGPLMNDTTVTLNYYSQIQVPLSLIQVSDNKQPLSFYLYEHIGNQFTQTYDIDGFTWNPSNRTIMILATNQSSIGTHVFQIVAIDYLNRTVSTKFEITVISNNIGPGTRQNYNKVMAVIGITVLLPVIAFIGVMIKIKCDLRKARERSKKLQ